MRKNVSKENNVKHMIAVGAVMKQTASRIGEDAHEWEIVGILHDVDFETCSGPSDHTLKAKEILRGVVDDEIMATIIAHNFENTKVAVDTKMKKGLICSDAVSGLVLACALVMPSKKLAEVKPESVLKKYGSKDFAKNVSREKISMCGDLGLSLEDFLSISLEGMKKVSDELGL